MERKEGIDTVEDDFTLSGGDKRLFCAGDGAAEGVDGLGGGFYVDVEELLEALDVGTFGPAR